MTHITKSKGGNWKTILISDNGFGTGLDFQIIGNSGQVWVEFLVWTRYSFSCNHQTLHPSSVKRQHLDYPNSSDQENQSASLLQGKENIWALQEYSFSPPKSPTPLSVIPGLLASSVSILKLLEKVTVHNCCTGLAPRRWTKEQGRGRNTTSNLTDVLLRKRGD